MVKSFFLSWGTNFVGLAIAGLFFSGIQYQDKLRVSVVAGPLKNLVNALIRPAVIILSLPAIVITLGLFTLVVNTAMLYITSAIYKPFQVTSLWSAVGAVMVVWLVNYLSVSLVKEPQS